MLYDVNQNSIVANPYACCARVPQLYNILALFVHLCLFYFAHVVVVAFAERVADLLTPNAYYYMPVV
jgi:hypothetical protein